MAGQSARRQLIAALLLALIALAACARPVLDKDADGALEKKKGKGKGGKGDKKVKHPFTSPMGLFIQERASKQLPGPGQHFSFGALVSWEQVHATVDADPATKLVLLVRHGQAVSNWLSDTLGPDEWFVLEEKCAYTDDNSTAWGIFDAELTQLGLDQAQGLNSMLAGAGWFAKLTAGKPTCAIVSPLSRCLQTALGVTPNLPLTGIYVEENVRETLGEDTCDARRSVSNPHDPDPGQLQGPCPFEKGIAAKFPQFKFPILSEKKRRSRSPDAAPVDMGFGLISDKDTLWTKDRETQKHQTDRAVDFLYDLFDYVKEQVVVVITHSGFTRSVLLAVGREPYRPQNTELVPVIITRGVPPATEDDAVGEYNYDDATSTY